MNTPDHHESSAEPRPRTVLHEVVLRLDQFSDRTRARFRGPTRRITIEPYLAHGSADVVVARGRVFSGAPVRTATGVEPLWKRLRRGLRRFLTNESAGIQIRLELGAATGIGMTDAEGYYRIELPDHGLPMDQLLHPLELTVVDPPDGVEVAIGTARAHIPTSHARRLIVSDIDDTVLATDATRTLRMLVTTLTGSAWTRQGFPGTPELYSGLARGAGDEDNAFVYVSSSPWNLYGFLIAFVQRTGLPVGPLFLRDLGVDETKFIHGHHDDHKSSAIAQLLAIHDVPFVLIGDTGQRDPEIYRTIAESHPGRIEAILFRHLASEERAEAVRSLFQGIDIPVALADDAIGLARTSESAGLVPGGWTARVAQASEPEPTR